MRYADSMNDFFANLSGSSQQIRDSTGDFRSKDTTIYAIFGIWAVIIAFIAGAGGYFFAETFTSSKPILYMIAILWGSMIFLIERLMIAIPISQEEMWKNIILIIFRFAMTFFASITVTHNIVTNYFYDDSITEILVENSDSNRMQKIAELQSKITNINGSFAPMLATLEEEKICLNTLLKEEKGFDNHTIKTILTNSGVSCGSTSGEGSSCGNDCKQIKADINEKENEILETKSNLKDMLSPIDLELERTKNNTDYAKDVISRTEALAQLTDKHPSVARTTFFFTALLVSAEMLIVVLKTLMPKLASDYVYESNMKYFDKMNRLHNDLDYNFEKQMEEAKYNFQAEHNQASIAMRTMKSSLETLLDEIQETQEMFDEYRQNKKSKLGILNFKSKRKAEKELNEIEDVVNQTRQAALDKFMSSLNNSNR